MAAQRSEANAASASKKERMRSSTNGPQPETRHVPTEPQNLPKAKGCHVHYHFNQTSRKL